MLCKRETLLKLRRWGPRGNGHCCLLMMLLLLDFVVTVSLLLSSGGGIAEKARKITLLVSLATLSSLAWQFGGIVLQHRTFCIAASALSIWRPHDESFCL